MDPVQATQTNTKRRRGRIDRDAPKKPITSYFCFAKTRRRELQLLFPEHTMPELTTIMAAEWRRLPLVSRKPYEDQSLRDKQRYEREMKLYLQRTVIGAPLQRRKQRDPSKPRKNMSAYLFFHVQESARLREMEPGISFESLGRRTADIWRHLPHHEKAPYIALSERDKHRFATEMRAYRGEPAVEDEGTARSPSSTGGVDASSDSSDSEDEGLGPAWDFRRTG